MKKAILFFSFFVSLFVFSSNASAQKQIEPQVQRDPILETDAKHNLEVARQYFTTKRAYRAVLMRFEETFAAYPQFSKMDEFLYYAGMSSFYLSNNKGKQRLEKTATANEKEKYAPEKMREEAVAYLSQLVKDYPQSQFKADAEKILKQIEAKK
ncbi:MAG TPA: outer membrane protein assembly factor BamD [Pyrinomonadaceae bacterium]|nr:outer membrane protein assembly factor BamD [Pyrinomonadaceae bacterium]